MTEMNEIAVIGIGLFGAALGLITGLIVAKYVGLQPETRELQRALAANDEYYKQRIARMRGMFKEYEQPTELQQMASQLQGAAPGDMVSMLIANLGGIKGLPKWLRPFLPAIESYIKDNPEKVQALMQKFLSGNKQEASAEGSL